MPRALVRQFPSSRREGLQGAMLIMVYWNPDVVALTLGPIELRWYSLFWVIGLILAYVIVGKLYKQQQIQIGRAHV